MKQKLDINKEMEVFDQLPAKIRAALNYGPVKYIHIESLRRFKDWEVDGVAKLIRAGKLPAVKVEVDCN